MKVTAEANMLTESGGGGRVLFTSLEWKRLLVVTIHIKKNILCCNCSWRNNTSLSMVQHQFISQNKRELGLRPNFQLKAMVMFPYFIYVGRNKFDQVWSRFTCNTFACISCISDIIDLIGVGGGFHAWLFTYVGVYVSTLGCKYRACIWYHVCPLWCTGVHKTIVC